MYYATDNSQLSFAGQRDRSNVCKRGAALLFCARDPELLAERQGMQIESASIHLDKSRRRQRGERDRERALNWMIGVESTARQSIEVTQVRQVRTVVSLTVGLATSGRPTVSISRFSLFIRSLSESPTIRRNNISAARHWDHVDGAPAF